MFTRVLLLCGEDSLQTNMMALTCATTTTSQCMHTCELHIAHRRKKEYLLRYFIIVNHRTTTAIEWPKRPFQNYALERNYTVKSSLSESVNALMKEGLQFLKTGFYDNAPHMRSYHTLHCNFIFAIYSTRLNRYTKYQGIEHSTRPILLNI